MYFKKLSCEEKIFIESFEENFSRCEVLEFLSDCECEDVEGFNLNEFKENLENKLKKMTDEEFHIAMNTIN